MTLQKPPRNPVAMRRLVHVLLVESCPDDARWLHESLRQQADFQLHGARSIEEARALLEDRTFDAAVVDQCGNPAEARKFIETLRDDWPEVAVVALDDGHAVDGEALPGAVVSAMRKVAATRRRDTMVRWLEREARVDQLTGLYNRHAFDDRLKEVCESAREAKRYVTLILLDVVGTRMVNEAHGRETGDDVIRRAATGVTRSVRGVDFAARIDGDDFGVILPGADLEIGRLVARRIAHELERLNGSDWGGQVPVEVAFGVAAGIGCGDRELFAAANRELSSCKSRTAIVTDFPDLDDPNDPSVA